MERDKDTCLHSITSVMETRTFVKNGRTWTEQKLACVDCRSVCEINIY